MRGVGYGVGTAANVAASIILLRYLGVAQFGSYVAVMSVVTIAGGLSDGGLSAVGNRELARVEGTQARSVLLARLLGLRLVLTASAMALAIAFGVLAGFPSELLWGLVLAAGGWTLISISSAAALPLSVDLRIVSLTVLEVIKQLGFTLAIIVAVLLGADLAWIFAAMVPGALLALAVTPKLTGPGILSWPTFHMRDWGDLVAKSVPIALAAVVNVVYIRFLSLAMFQMTSDVDTGLFGTSARIIETIGGLPLLAYMVALPVLSTLHGTPEGGQRIRGLVQGMFDAGVVFAGLVIVFLFLGADPLIAVLGGSEYGGAVQILQIQCFALAGITVSAAFLMAAIALDRRRLILIAYLVGLGLVICLGIPAIELWGANGAAIATVVADVVMAIAFGFMLLRDVRPRLRSLWLCAAACALALAGVPALGLTPIPTTVLGVAVYVALALSTKALPREVLHALRPSSNIRASENDR